MIWLGNGEFSELDGPVGAPGMGVPILLAQFSGESLVLEESILPTRISTLALRVIPRHHVSSRQMAICPAVGSLSVIVGVNQNTVPSLPHRLKAIPLETMPKTFRVA